MGNRHPCNQEISHHNNDVASSDAAVVDRRSPITSPHSTPLHQTTRIRTTKVPLNKSISDSFFPAFCLPESSMATLNSFTANTMSNGSQRPPLKFNVIHGENVRLTKNQRMASRTDSFCKALAFSDRSIEIDEVVCLRFSEVKTNWSGVLRFGLTNMNPVSFGENLPKYACPDMTSKEGTWAKAMSDRYCQQGNIMHFFVRENGEMYYGINGSLKGLFLSGINTRVPMFVVVDIYGNTTSVEFVDDSELVPLRRAREGQSNARPAIPSPPTVPPPAPPVVIPAPPAPLAVPEPSPSPRVQQQQQQQQPETSASVARQQLARELEQRLNFAQLQERSLNVVVPATVNNNPKPASPPRRVQDLTLAQLTYNRSLPLTPLQFHETRGRTVNLNGDRTIATRVTALEFCCGYVFTSRPIRFNEKVVVQILSVQLAYEGGLGFGVTNCDPSQLVNFEFPDDADDLLNRPEFWAVNKDYERHPNVDDEMTYFLNEKGELVYQRNNETPRTLMYVDPSLTYHMFFDVYGRVQRIRCAGTADARLRMTAPAPPTIPQHRRRQHQATTSQAHNRRATSTPSMSNAVANGPPPVRPATAILQQFQSLQVNSHQGQPARPPLTVNLPPHTQDASRRTEASRQSTTVQNGNAAAPHIRSAPLRHHHEQRHGGSAPPRPNRPPPPAPPQFANSSVSSANNGSAVQVQNTNAASSTRPSTSGAAESSKGITSACVAKTAGSTPANNVAGGECTVCMDHPINCAVYPCGHVCMCFECGHTTWNRQGVCPICRETIKDILRLFPSS